MRKGRVLKVKTGYNPNSSSVGSQVPAFLAWAAGAGAFTVVALHLYGVVRRLARRRKGDTPPEEEKRDE